VMGSLIDPSSGRRNVCSGLPQPPDTNTNLMGLFRNTFGQKGVGPVQFDGPMYVIGDANNRSIVSDSGNHTGFKHSLIMVIGYLS
jgi:hypothetical protein